MTDKWLDRDRDVADAFALLDDGQTVSARCDGCGGFICSCDDHGEALRAFRARARRVGKWNS